MTNPSDNMPTFPVEELRDAAADARHADIIARLTRIEGGLHSIAARLTRDAAVMTEADRIGRWSRVIDGTLEPATADERAVVLIAENRRKEREALSREVATVRQGPAHLRRP